MAFPDRLALATKNPGKVREIMQICRDWPVKWLTAARQGADGSPTSSWSDVEEIGETYLENARLKAHVTANAVGVAALADDSGIEADPLGGGPGPRSARFAGDGATDEANLRLLIERIRAVPASQRTGRYRCVAVCAWPDGRDLWAEGICEGRLITEPQGTGGFGYDPIFVPEGERRTMAELSAEEKNAISHRGRAFRALRALVESAVS